MSNKDALLLVASFAIGAWAFFSGSTAATVTFKATTAAMLIRYAVQLTDRRWFRR